MNITRAWFALLATLALASAGCERKEKVPDVKVGGPDGGVSVEGYRSDDGSLEVKVDEK